MDKKTVLRNVTFGSRVAEEEVEGLRSYFVETEQWRKLFDGDVDVVYGPKGAGKSALYSLLVGEKETLRLGRRTVFIAGENPGGTPAFRDLAADPPATEDQFRSLWKLYFLTLVANYLRHHFETTRTTNRDAVEVISCLTENHLLSPNLTLIGRLKAALDYVRNRLPAVEASYTDPSTGGTIAGKITLREPTTEQRNNGFMSADDLLTKLNGVLQETKITVWLVLDRLDVAFLAAAELERNALRSLFRVYLDMNAYSNIAIKIFLRDDIWRAISGDGFREASHITRTLTISWNHQTLLNLIVRRLAYNEAICNFYGMNRDDVLANADLQMEFFYRVFPTKIDIGPKQPSTLDWMLSRVADGSKRYAPREMIHLLSVARDEQLKLYEVGSVEPSGQNLFDRSAIRAALPAVSKARYEQTLCAENPVLKPYLEKMAGEKTQHTPKTLGKLWQLSPDAAYEIAERLAEAGFFEKRGPKDTPSYWVPFLYRPALGLVQGSA
jgi:hypothetical protein